MKLSLIIASFVLAWSNLMQSQNLALEFSLDLKRTEFGNYQQTVDISGNTFQDFIALSIRIVGDVLINDGVRVRVKTNDSLYFFNQFHEEIIEGQYVGDLIYLPVTETGQLRFEFDFNSGINVENLTGVIRFFSPGGSKVETKPFKKKSGARDFSDCECPQPVFIPRSSWGSGFGLNENIFIPPAAYTEVTHLIVHHSAGPNFSSNWPGIVASIFDFHVNTNGWQDVGYNWLIDPDGVIYEGRGGGDNVRGAHMCGYNNNTMGVCVMGNYTSVQPSNNSLNALKDLLAWKCCRETIDPLGSAPKTSYSGYMKNISGHKDGCTPNYTECPGLVLYSIMDSIRIGTNKHIDTLCTSPSSYENDFLSKIIAIYPNPAKELMQIENLANIQIDEVCIFDTFGHVLVSVQNFKSNVLKTIDLSELRNGFYFVRIKTLDGFIVKKMTKLH